MTDPDIYTETRISMLNPELRQRVRDNPEGRLFST